jgi:hypothetical protein
MYNSSRLFRKSKNNRVNHWSENLKINRVIRTSKNKQSKSLIRKSKINRVNHWSENLKINRVNHWSKNLNINTRVNHWSENLKINRVNHWSENLKINWVNHQMHVHFIIYTAGVYMFFCASCLFNATLKAKLWTKY